MVASFTRRSLYREGKTLLVSIAQGLCELLNSRCGVLGEDAYRPCRESNHDASVVQPVSQSLYRLSYLGSRSDDDDDNIKVNERGIEFEAADVTESDVW